MRVRIKELAQEAKFIRFEEEKIRKKKLPTVKCGEIWEFWRLRDHRTKDVRNAARAAQLAYGFLRGVPYRKIEPYTKPLGGSYSYEQTKWKNIQKEVKRLATKFKGFSKSENFDAEIENWFLTP